MKITRLIVVLLLASLLSGCAPKETQTTSEIAPADRTSATSPVPEEITPEDKELTDVPESTALAETPPAPDPYTALYDCEMEITFTSGPLQSKTSAFTVLSEDYFLDKGDKFKPGKGTSVYYSEQHYFILHSSFVNGNVLRPMEAEFIRKFLEYWGTSGTAYIQDQIDSLIGSDVSWVCDGQQVFETKITGIERLSHEAANHIWLEPEDIEEILTDREGLISEWVGTMEETAEPHLYIGFCGWGPESAGDERFTYFRYLIQFDILED